MTALIGTEWPRLELLRRFISFGIGRPGATLAISAVVAPTFVTLADLVIAATLLLFIQSFGLADGEAASWTPLWLHHAPAVVVWVVLLGVVALQSALFISAYQTRTLLSERFQLRLRAILAHLMLPSAGAPPQISSISYLSADVIPGATRLVGATTQFAAFLVQGTTLALALLWIAPGEALVGFAGFAMAATAVMAFNGRAQRAARGLPPSGLAMSQQQGRAARSWLLIRALRLQPQERVRYVDASRAHYRAAVESFFFANLGLGTTPLFALLIIAVTMVARELVFGTSPAILMGFLYLFIRFQFLLAYGSQVLGEVTSVAPFLYPAMQMVVERSDSELRAALEALAPATSSSSDQGLGGSLTRPGPPRIEARNLAFAWSGHEWPIIDSLCSVIEAGHQVGVVGPNGSGKSTLLALLLGAIRPAAGTLTLDAEPAASWVDHHAMFVGYVGPDPCLIAGTIRQNLCYGLNRDCSTAEIMDILDRVQLTSSIFALTDRLEHAIGESGEELSTGEKQKLALARALLRDPVLLLLDEPTASVDRRSEAEIVGAIAELRGRCTVVLVTHEPRVLRFADSVIRFGDEGTDRAHELGEL